MAQATLTVWKFNTPQGAEDAAQTLEGLARQHIVTLHDAATVSWEEGEKKPRTRSSASTTAEPAHSADPSGGCCSA